MHQSYVSLRIHVPLVNSVSFLAAVQMGVGETLPAVRGGSLLTVVGSLLAVGAGSLLVAERIVT
ncbi:hypothetical protein SAMN05518846_108116 [Brevibacillus centrosporus]|uniref:Uncharacterized protein n=1 Tax=Brevibacillus centrosporus TaxID=54910 RepID=A0A1I3WJP1_9BACL|nr:hypothetical protein SAMN05518846_108116 [Brevibacillus centrosporus]